MTPRALADKIEKLPPEERTEVENFVELVRQRYAQRRSVKSAPDELLARIDARRERLFRERGPFPDSTVIIRELRDHGE